MLLTALELAKALAYLHRLDILHGDLTGGNVMLTSAPTTANDPRGFTVKVQLFSGSHVYVHSFDCVCAHVSVCVALVPVRVIRNRTCSCYQT